MKPHGKGYSDSSSLLSQPQILGYRLMYISTLVINSSFSKNKEYISETLPLLARMHSTRRAEVKKEKKSTKHISHGEDHGKK